MENVIVAYVFGFCWKMFNINKGAIVGKEIGLNLWRALKAFGIYYIGKVFIFQVRKIYILWNMLKEIEKL